VQYEGYVVRHILGGWRVYISYMGGQHDNGVWVYARCMNRDIQHVYYEA
jgi:hypothetical protein